MTKTILTQNDIQNYARYLRQEEKSDATIEKYLRDVGAFWRFTQSEALSKELVIRYKRHLQEQHYALRSINSMLASVNSLLAFLGLSQYRAKSLRQQRQTYLTEDRELSKEEYFRLLSAAEARPQLRLIMQTICGTGIRVSELRYFTVAAVRAGEIVVRCKKEFCFESTVPSSRRVYLP